MRKQIYTLFLALLIAVSPATIFANAEESEESQVVYGKIPYTMVGSNKQGTCNVIKYDNHVAINANE